MSGADGVSIAATETVSMELCTLVHNGHCTLTVWAFHLVYGQATSVQQGLFTVLDFVIAITIIWSILFVFDHSL